MRVRIGPGGPGDGRRQPVVGVVVQGRSEADLPDVIEAADAGGSVADFLDGGEQQAGQDGDRRYHDEEFEQGIRGAARHGVALNWSG